MISCTLILSCSYIETIISFINSRINFPTTLFFHLDALGKLGKIKLKKKKNTKITRPLHSILPS